MTITERVIAYHRANPNLSCPQIADATGISVNTIYGVVNRLNLPVPRLGRPLGTESLDPFQGARPLLSETDIARLYAGRRYEDAPIKPQPSAPRFYPHKQSPSRRNSSMSEL